MSTTFLTADWRNVLLLNFEIDPDALRGFAPNGTEVATFNGKTFVSVVGFQFLHTRVYGIPIPFHRNFEEVNLRFYVRRKHGDGWRRGVVFIKELVPRRAVAWTARLLYNENYQALPMSHEIDRTDGAPTRVAYAWRYRGTEHGLAARVSGPPQTIADDSPEEYFAHHEWGYVRDRRGQTVEYRVDHPRWRVAPVADAALRCDAAALYGPAFSEALSRPPHSALFADGSAVTVYRGTRITP
jgi:uncharacterized protein YqjF (DUF2071 family)